MKLDPSLRELIAINLQYDAGSEALNVRAIAQLLAKVLFSRGRLVSMPERELAKSAAKVLGIAKVSDKQVSAGLDFLREKLGFAKETSRGQWLLTNEGYDAVEQDVRKAEQRRLGVLERHFPQRIDQGALAIWFNDACVAFYSIYGTQWAAALAGSPSPAPLGRDTLLGLLRNTISLNGLELEKDELVHGFSSFLSSQEPEDIAHHWSLGQALLAARIVAANLGPDPVISQALRGSTLLFDTNMLLVTALERHRHASALEDLGQVLHSMKIQLEFIEDTRAEYTLVVDAERNSLLRALDAFPIGVLEASNDAFILTALDRACIAREDFVAFFDSLLDPPSTLGDHVPITVRADSQTQALAEKGRADERLAGEITTNWNRLRPGRKKSSRAAQHDAALTAVAEGLVSQGINCAVLTLDRTMHEHSLRRSGAKGLPQWLSLDALIQILAVQNAGGDFDAAEFAPLLAEIIRQQCQPMMDTYKAQDLAIMLDVDERCAELNIDEMKAIAITVARQRLQGRDRRDPELTLAIRRAFQSGKLNLAQELDVLSADLRSREDQLAAVSVRDGVATELAVRSMAAGITWRAHLLFSVKVLSVLLWSGIGTWAAIAIAKKYSTRIGAEFVGLEIGVLGLLVAPAIWWLITDAIPKWNAERSGALVVAAARVEAEIQRVKDRT